MRVLVTGAKGFLGRRVVLALRSHGHEVRECYHVTGRPNYDGLGVDLCLEEDAIAVSRGVDAVVHLAARVGGIGANQKSPGAFWRDNLKMGMNVLEAARICRVPKLLMVGTTCSYPRSPKTIPFVEEELFDGYPEATNAPYGIAKRALLAGAIAYRAEFNLNVVTVIPTNLYGPGDNFEPATSHVIPAMIQKFHDAKVEGRPVVDLWGTGEPTRDFLYVDDAAEGISRALQVYDAAAPLNLGSGIEISIKLLADLVRETVGYRGTVQWDLLKPDGQPRRVLATARARQALAWCASTPLGQGLKMTYDWFLDKSSGRRS